jgi:long-chain acyl-CoA synthetase
MREPPLPSRHAVVALVVLDRDETTKLAARLDIPNDVVTITSNPRVRREIQCDVTAVNAKLARIEQVKRFAILDHDLSQSGGKMTPTLKVKRPVVCDKYAEVFAALYADEHRS